MEYLNYFLPDTFVTKIKQWRLKSKFVKRWEDKNLEPVVDPFLDLLQAESFKFQSEVFLLHTPEILKKLNEINFLQVNSEVQEWLKYHIYPDFKQWQILYNIKHNICFIIVSPDDWKALKLASDCCKLFNSTEELLIKFFKLMKTKVK